MKSTMQQAPIRNGHSVAAFVNSHSGEFAPDYTDLRLTGRGLDLVVIRAYRSSLAEDVRELGRGWSSSITKKIQRDGDDLVYHNGAGETYRFGRGKKRSYIGPAGLYAVLIRGTKEILIQKRFGYTCRFDTPERGGRIVSIEDRNHNTIQFSYSVDRIAILDTLGRKIAVSITTGLVRELTDHAGRSWTYDYDKDHRLVKVTQPTTADYPQGTSIRYAYDGNHRLVSVTDAKGQRYLVNHYDALGRIVIQEHGNELFKMEYEAVDKDLGGSPPYRTTCRRKNGSVLTVDHNGVGNVLSRTAWVREESFSPIDRKAGTKGVALTTTSEYNSHSELISRVFPAGNRTEWVYSEDEKDPRNQGNLLQISDIAQAGVESEQTTLVTRYEYEHQFQLRTSVVDPRGIKTSYRYDKNGNLVTRIYPAVTIQPISNENPRPLPFIRNQESRFEYNQTGQLVRQTHIDGAVTEYHYYSLHDPIGATGPYSTIINPDRACGYLARIIQDANGKNITNEYAYDRFGNTTTIWDGKRNPAHVQYNAMGKVESITTRAPFKYKISYKYDPNYNEIESTQSFERLSYDDTTQTIGVRSNFLQEQKEYNALDHVIGRKLVGGDLVAAEYFIRDAEERITRQIQPLGNRTDYVYDERNLLIERTFGVGTRDEFSERFTYTANGSVRSYTDGNGNTTIHRYDGFQRYRGFTNPVGTTKTQWFDETGNVVRVAIIGNNSGTVRGSGNGERADEKDLMEAMFHFDEWNRAYRIDRVWRDPVKGDILGASKWDDRKGMVSSVLEFHENGLPERVWTEAANVLSVEYDGLRQVVRISDTTGEGCVFEYDENGNQTRMRHCGSKGEERRYERVLRRTYDEMDRPASQQDNDEALERFRYNALGVVIQYIGKSGIEIHHTHDALGRKVGHTFAVADPVDGTKTQRIVRRFEYDANYRLVAYTDASGRRTMYRHDALDRQTNVLYPDGHDARVEYDANGNVVRIVDQNNNEIDNQYDAANRLVERRSRCRETDTLTVAKYEHDGLNRIVSAVAPGVKVRRTYDSLSRLMIEEQGKHVLRFTRDSGGNVVSLLYPGGERVHKAYDIRNRATAVINGAGKTVARIVYRTEGQIARVLLGEGVEADYTYDHQERLASIGYRRTDTQKVLVGFRYQYDGAGRMTHEIQLSQGATYGERYYYDDASRPTKAQYGVQDVFDPSSTFEQETSYEYFPEGSWQRRIDIDGGGRMIDERAGTLNQLNRYSTLGSISFVYDANGNCTRKGQSNPGFCLYTYDSDNRLTKAECFDSRGTRMQTIEYYYDALGRQVRKDVTDQAGATTEYTYVWAANTLLQEYENGILARTYVYSIGSTPAQLSVTKNGKQSDYFYILNGRGLVCGILPDSGLNALAEKFAEKYGYEVTGHSFVTEIDGLPVAIPARGATVSGLANSILSGNAFGPLLRDWENGTFTGVGGRHIDPKIDAVLNSFSALLGKGHYDARSAFGTQLNDALNMLGLGVGAGESMTGGSASKPVMPFKPDMSWYGDAADAAFDFSGKSPGGIPTDSSGGATPKDSRIQWIQDLAGKIKGFMDTSLTVGPAGGLETTPGALIGGVFSGAGSGYTNPAKNAPAAGSNSSSGTPPPNAAEQYALEAQEKARKQAETEDKQASEKEKKELDAIQNAKKEDEGTASAYVAPDYLGSGTGQTELPIYASRLQAPKEVEAKLNRVRRPVNPNGPEAQIDRSFPPPKKKGGIDPTVAYSGSEMGASMAGEVNAEISIAPIDHVPGWNPFTTLQQDEQTSEHQLPRTIFDY